MVSVSTDMWTLGVLQKQESEGEEALWLVGLPERDNPAGESTTALNCRVPGPNTTASTLEAVAGCEASSHPGLSST